jgi:photosystem II stability/assembly factor-like uncharacterized protein
MRGSIGFVVGLATLAVPVPATLAQAPAQTKADAPAKAESSAKSDAPAKTPAKAQVDVLDRPAIESPLASRGMLQGMARVGNRLVAVGMRGHIVVSTDNGATWKQSKVPVSSDLVAVYFPSEKNGWAVGHDGVVLATTDGGDTWVKQLDGRQQNALLLKSLTEKSQANPGSAELKEMLAEAERYKEQGPDKPILDVWFENDTTGYIVGAYNLIWKTTDGGQTWESLFDRTENPKFLNLYAIRPTANGLYVVGEGGLVMKLDPATQRFKALPVDYKGSFFGVVDAKPAVLVYGLRGNVFRSEDGGKTWTKVNAGLPATVVSGTRLGDAVILADQSGRLATSTDAGKTFTPLAMPKPMPITSVVDGGEGKLAITGLGGAMVAVPAAPAR